MGRFYMADGKDIPEEATIFPGTGLFTPNGPQLWPKAIPFQLRCRLNVYGEECRTGPK